MTSKNTDFKIKVTNKQNIDGSVDKIIEKTTGSFQIRNGKKYILYKITDDGVETSNTVIISNDGVCVTRKGFSFAKMEFNLQKQTQFLYKTAYGAFDVILDTEKISDTLDKNGGSLRLVYTLSMQGTRIYNDMEITISK